MRCQLPAPSHRCTLAPRRAPAVAQRVLSTAAGSCSSAAGPPPSQPAAAAGPACLATYLDSVLLQPGAGCALLRARPALRERLTTGRAQRCVEDLRSVGATREQAGSSWRSGAQLGKWECISSPLWNASAARPSPARAHPPRPARGAFSLQVAAMLRANPRYLTELEGDKFRACVAAERAAPGSVLGALPRLEVTHLRFDALGGEEAEVGADAELPPLFLATTAALEESVGACAALGAAGGSGSGSGAPAAPMGQQQFQSLVDAWLGVGSNASEG